MARLWILSPLISLKKAKSKKKKQLKLDPLWQNFLDPPMERIPMQSLQRLHNSHTQSMKVDDGLDEI